MGVPIMCQAEISSIPSSSPSSDPAILTWSYSWDLKPAEESGNELSTHTVGDCHIKEISIHQTWSQTAKA